MKETLSNTKFMGYVRSQWHSLCRTLSTADHRMTTIDKAETDRGGNDELAHLPVGTRIAITCQCNKVFWIHPAMIKLLQSRGEL